MNALIRKLYRQGKVYRRLLLAAVLALVGLAGLAASMAKTFNDHTSSIVSQAAERVIVRYRPNTDSGALTSLFEEVGAEEVDSIPGLYIKTVRVEAGRRDTVIAQLRGSELIESAEEERAAVMPVAQARSVARLLKPAAVANVPDDEYYPAQRVWRTVNADILWDSVKGESNITVGIISTGINAGHEEFIEKVVPGYNFRSNNADTSDKMGYGTILAGIAAGRANNGVGVTGGCWNCKIMPLKVLEDAGGFLTDYIKAIEYGVQQKVSVLMVGQTYTGSCSSAVQAAVNKATSANIPLISPSSFQVEGDAPNYYGQPASCTSAISVAPSGRNHLKIYDPNNPAKQQFEEEDTLMQLFTRQSPEVDIAAPGNVGVAVNFQESYDTDGTIWVGEEDEAAAVVAGMVGLLRTAFPAASVAEITSVIKETTDPLRGTNTSLGRINALRAYQYLKGGGTVADSVAPVIGEVKPADATTPGGKVTMGVAVTDNVAVARVDLFVDGFIRKGKEVWQAPYEFNWDTAEYIGKTIELKAIAIDTSGNSSIKTWTVTPGDTPTPNPVPTPTPNPNPNPTPKTGDLNNDGKVNISDLSILLSNWGKSGVPADLNNSGKVDITDLSILLSKWG